MGIPKTKQKEVLGKVMFAIRQYRGLVMLSMVLAIVIVVLTLAVPIIIGKAIDSIVYGQIDFAQIGRYVVTVVIVVGITAVAQWLMNHINNKVTFNVARDLRNEAFQKLEILPLQYLDTHAQGEIVSRLITDVDQFTEGLLMGFTTLFTGVMTIVGTLFFMLGTDVGTALVVIVVTPVSLFVARFIAQKTYHMFKLQSEARGQQTALIDEMITNHKVVKAYRYEKEAIQQFDMINESLGKYSLRAMFYSSLTNPCTRFVNSIVYAGVAVVGALTVVTGRMTVGTLSCFLSYANQYTKPFNEISGVITELQNAIACAGRIFELIEERPQVEESVNAHQLQNVEGEVSCQNVSFSYTPQQKLIQNFSMHITPGQKVAIVGPTGCGKTTLINLLMRFYDVDAGCITVEHTDIRELTRRSLRTNYGMVLQETWLKKGTIRDNISMGKLDATDEEVIDAAKASYAHSFIKRMPQGYETVIGEEGGQLSQGQKQLLCIARVMLCKPPMLILDEATSSIDTRTEMKIQNAFNKLMEGRTSFIVAHRLSTIQNADLILVMKEGKVIEQGDHEMLLAQEGFYTKLYNSQFAR